MSTIVAILLSLSCIMAVRAAAPADVSDTSAKAVAAAAGRYVAGYERQLAYVLADETYVQATFNGAHQETAHRTMHGELFLTFMPLDHEWIAVHDIADVDGEPVPDRDDVAALIQQGAIRRIAQQLADRNASFNIGRVQRNFNEPTLGLLILGEQRIGRTSFSTTSIRRGPDATLVTLHFEERETPTLVSDVDGRPIRAHGEITVEAGTGVVRHTHLEFDRKGIVSALDTEFALDGKLGLWVPAVFTEHYDVTSGLSETIRCEATYSNYRRFEAKAAIK